MLGNITVSSVEVIHVPLSDGLRGEILTVKVQVENEEKTTIPGRLFSKNDQLLSLRKADVDFTFSVESGENDMKISLLSETGVLGRGTIKILTLAEKGTFDESVTLNIGGFVQVVGCFKFSSEEEERIASLRAEAMQNQQEEILFGDAEETIATDSDSGGEEVVPQTQAVAASPVIPVPAVPAPVVPATALPALPLRPPAPAPAPVPVSAPVAVSRTLPDSAAPVSQVSTDRVSGAAVTSAVDTSAPFENVQSQVQKIEELKEKMKKLPDGSKSLLEAREKLMLETESLRRAEEIHRRSTRGRLGAARQRAPNIFQQIQAQVTEKLGGSPLGDGKGGVDVAKVAKTALGAIGFFVVAFIFRPRPNKMIYKVKEGDSITHFIPDDYCEPDSNFYALNTEVCERSYALPGEKIGLPKEMYEE